MATLAAPRPTVRDRSFERSLAVALTAPTGPPPELASPSTLARATRVRGEQMVPWPLQEELWGEVLAGRWVLVLKARQLGVTWALAVLALWWVLTKPGQTVLILSIGERESRSVMRRVRLLWRWLPDSVTSRYKVLTESTERFEVDHPTGPSAVTSLPAGGGRGETADLVIGDEAAFWRDADDRLADILPAAADQGQVVLVSTANGDAGRYRDEWNTVDHDTGFPWHRMFFDPLARPGRTSAWVTAIRAKLGVLGPQEYPYTPDEAFLTSGSCPFDPLAMRDLEQEFCRPPVFQGRFLRHEKHLGTDPDPTGPLQIWEWPQPGQEYVIAADCAGGPTGLDWSHAVVYDQARSVQVAAWHGKPEPRQYALELARLGWFYRGADRPALLAPEVNGVGAGVVAYLEEFMYPRLWAREDLTTDGDGSRVRSGWLTTTTSKPVLVGALQEGIRSGGLGVRDVRAIGECRTFERRQNPGTLNVAWGARDGCHDDRVIAHGIAAALLDLSSQTGGPVGGTAGRYRGNRSRVAGY